MDYEFRVGDLVTVWTGGWDKRMREQYEGRAGIITQITDGPLRNTYPAYWVNFGWGDVEVTESRLRPLTRQNE